MKLCLYNYDAKQKIRSWRSLYWILIIPKYVMERRLAQDPRVPKSLLSVFIKIRFRPCSSTSKSHVMSQIRTISLILQNVILEKLLTYILCICLIFYVNKLHVKTWSLLHGITKFQNCSEEFVSGQLSQFELIIIPLATHSLAPLDTKKWIYQALYLSCGLQSRKFTMSKQKKAARRFLSKNLIECAFSKNVNPCFESFIVGCRGVWQLGGSILVLWQ